MSEQKIDQQSAVDMIKAAAAKQAAVTPQQQQGTPFDFSKIHLHIGIPCYGGMVSEPTMTSFLRFTLMAQQAGLNWSLDTMVNESLVTRARNNLMAKMMTNPVATHFMFIDADIRFQPESILQMLSFEKEVIGGLYPKKTLPVSYVLNLKPETKIQTETLIITFNRLVKDSDTDYADVVTADVTAALEQVAQELVGSGVVVEVQVA